MKTFEEYSLDKLQVITPEIEELFVESAHINELILYFDLFEKEDTKLCYFYNDEPLFVQKTCKKSESNVIWISFWDDFLLNDAIEYNDVWKIMNYMIYKYFNMYLVDKEYYPSSESVYFWSSVKNKFIV